MLQFLLDFRILLLIILSVGIGILYFYLQHTKSKDAFWLRVQKVKGEAFSGDHVGLSLRHEVWFSKFMVTGLKDILRKMSADAVRRYRLKFERAGWDPQDAPLIGSTINIGLILLGFFIFVIMITNISTFEEASLLIQLILLIIILFIALRSFEYLMDFIIGKRYDKIRLGLSYAIDLMGICMRSGYGLERSFEKIAEEMSKYNKDLCTEFAKTAIELSILPERSIALRNLALRVDIPIVQILASGLIQAEEQGAPLGDTLRMMSIEFSKQKMLEVEAKATKLPALLTLPLLLFLLPAMMIVVLGPAITNLTRSNYF